MELHADVFARVQGVPVRASSIACEVVKAGKLHVLTSTSWVQMVGNTQHAVFVTALLNGNNSSFTVHVTRTIPVQVADMAVTAPGVDVLAAAVARMAANDLDVSMGMQVSICCVDTCEYCSVHAILALQVPL
jgi:hypothetical protein